MDELEVESEKADMCPALVASPTALRAFRWFVVRRNVVVAIGNFCRSCERLDDIVASMEKQRSELTDKC